MVVGLGHVLSAWSLEGLQNKGQQGTMPMSLDPNKNPRHLGSGELHWLAMLCILLPHIMAERNKPCLHNCTGRGLQEPYIWCLLDFALCTSSLWYFILYPVTVTNHDHDITVFLSFVSPSSKSLTWGWLVTPKPYLYSQESIWTLQNVGSLDWIHLLINNMKEWLKFDYLLKFLITET